MIFFKQTFLKDFAKERYMAIVRAYPRLQEDKTQRYILLTLTFLALSFLGILAINPTLKTITELNKKLEDSEFVNQALKTKLANLSSLNSQYERMSTDIPLIEAAVPSSAQAPFLLGQLRTLAKTTDVTITSLQTYQINMTQQKITPPRTVNFIFTLSIEGEKSNLVDFLHALNSFDRTVVIESLHFISEEEQRLTIRAKAFFIP